MFYSHEILMNHQYGVATIWLVATVGTGVGAKKKVTRKAIQEVDVQKACGKIIEPGAPVALRLQGHLLYGVSRVYSQQCGYMLSDLQKIQMHMHILFTKFGENQLDPEAGRTRPENLLILNDPDFVPDMVLPKFDLDALVASSQATQKTSSQMSPFDSTILSGSHNSRSPAPGYDIQFDLNNSPSPGPMGSPFGFQGFSSAQKSQEHRMLPDDDVFGGAEDLGFIIDGDGNIVESAGPPAVQDEFDLPPFPEMQGDAQEHVGVEQQKQPTMDGQGDVIMSDDAQQEGEMAMAQPPRDHHTAFLSDDHQHRAPARRKRKARALHADEETQIARSVMTKWQDDYLKNCGGPKARATGPAKAKANAMLLTFGLGLANVGQNLGVPDMIHPLALDFSGDSLFTTFTGLAVPAQPQGQRRSASESIEDGDEQGRRVRPRLEGDDVQLGRSLEGDDVFSHDGQQLHDSPEVGREAQAPMSDHLSSALNMPWNRGSSNIPGSSIRGSARKGHIPSSPLAGRGNIQDIVRFSEAPSIDDGGFDLGGLPSDNDDFDGFNLSPRGQKPESQGQQKADDWPTLDIEGRNFLSFMHTMIREHGERRLDEDFDVNRRWVAFEHVFVPKDTNHATAAQAFFHMLCLATKSQLEILHDGQPEVAFGGIWVGTKMDKIAATV